MPDQPVTGKRNNVRDDAYRALLHEFMHLGNRSLSRVEFLRQTVGLLLQKVACSAVELRLEEGEGMVVYRASRTKPTAAVGTTEETEIILERSFSGAWVQEEVPSANHSRHLDSIIAPLRIADAAVGVLRLDAPAGGYYLKADQTALEVFARTFSLILVNQRSQWALRERIKELTCLYGIARLAEKPDAPLEEVLQGVVSLIPPGWQYPEHTYGRIHFDEVEYATGGFVEAGYVLTSRLTVFGRERGRVDIVYYATGQNSASVSFPELDEGPFLREERSLIDVIARYVSQIIERKESAADRVRLEEQLRHADRLATIGQLAAGVAHELNEPLGGILGFAQLCLKADGLPESAQGDLNKIVNASLYAREIVRKLLLFSRQTPPRKTTMNVNSLIGEVASFFEGRAGHQNVSVEMDLATDLPDIIADPAQLNQVLVNLVVNALQAMPTGGRLTIATARNGTTSGEKVQISITDTGVGMTREVANKMFLPFFTTKNIHEGTGIGLSVVHGIVTAHGGEISVASQPDEGTTITILLPVNVNNNGDS